MEMQIPKKVKDLTGQRFGRVTAIEYVGNNNHRRARWRCRCDCGTVFVANSQDLVYGSTKSCGCYRKEKSLQQAIQAGILDTIPIRATMTDWSEDYPSIAEAARRIGCCTASIHNHLAAGTPFQGITFKKI